MQTFNETSTSGTPAFLHPHPPHLGNSNKCVNVHSPPPLPVKSISQTLLFHIFNITQQQQHQQHQQQHHQTQQQQQQPLRAHDTPVLSPPTLCCPLLRNISPVRIECKQWITRNQRLYIKTICLANKFCKSFFIAMCGGSVHSERSTGDPYVSKRRPVTLTFRKGDR